jgi:hypothetical protein
MLPLHQPILSQRLQHLNVFDWISPLFCRHSLFNQLLIKHKKCKHTCNSNILNFCLVKQSTFSIPGCVTWTSFLLTQRFLWNIWTNKAQLTHFQLRSRCSILTPQDGTHILGWDYKYFEQYYLLGCDGRIVWHKFTNVSEERTASVFRVKEWAMQASSAHSACYLLAQLILWTWRWRNYVSSKHQ